MLTPYEGRSCKAVDEDLNISGVECLVDLEVAYQVRFKKQNLLESNSSKGRKV